MRERQQYQLCALCNRPINTSNKIISGIGKVGPDCYSKYVGLESYMEQLQDKRFNYSVALQHINILKRSGIQARLKFSGENAYGSLYHIAIVGLLKRNTKQSYNKSFSEYRAEFAAWLKQNQQKINVHAAA